MAENSPAPVEKLASVLGDRYGTAIEPSHFRRATESELSEWMGRVGGRQPPKMRDVNELVLKSTANQEGGLNAFLVSGFEHASISEIAVAAVKFRMVVGDHMIHHGWWEVEDHASGDDNSSDNSFPCFYEFGPGSELVGTDPNNPVTPEDIANCFCVQVCVSCDDEAAGRDDCEGPCN